MALALERQHPVNPEPQYERFGESRLWAQQRAYYLQAGVEAWRRGEVPHYITSTAGTARVYADAIAEYWRCALAAGDVDPGEPLYVLELGAGCGRFTYLLHKALLAKLARLPRLRFCQLASDIVEQNLDFIASHPYLAPEVAAGRLDTALWNAETGGELRLRAQGTRVARTANPAVVVANYVFDGVRHDLLGVHHGQILDGRVAIGCGDGAQGTYEDGGLEYEWREVDSAGWLAPPLQRVLARYAERISSASLLLPSGALRCMDHVAALTRGRYLLLSADKGVHTEQELRGGASFELAVHGSFSLPVNYHALGACLEAQGALARNCRHREDGLVYQVALRGGKGAAYEECFAHIAERMDELNPDDYFTLKKAMETAAGGCTPDQLLAVLRLGRYDARILGLAIEPMLARAAELAGESQRLWHDVLERCWANYFPLGEADGFPFRFGLLAARLGYWGQARRAFRLDLATRGEDPDTLYQLAQCETSTGRAREALAWLERALAVEPLHRPCGAMRERLAARLDAPAPAGLEGCRDARDGELALQPLEIEHAHALLRQYRDPQIAAMTRLPDLGTIEETVEWIVAQRGEPGRASFAVMHAELGFAGMVSLCRHEDAAYFYFWTGADHQDAGYGRRAGALLLGLAAASGLREVFTSAYANNARSRKALAALGFRPLQASAEPPDNDLIFFLRAAHEDDRKGAAGRLRHLCRAIDSPFRFVGAGDAPGQARNVE